MEYEFWGLELRPTLDNVACESSSQALPVYERRIKLEGIDSGGFYGV